MDTKLNEKIKSWRKAKGMTLKQAANELSLSPSYISEMETMKKALSASAMRAYLRADPKYFKPADFFKGASQ